MKRHPTQNTVHRTLTVVLATKNEEENIKPCLESVEDIADEIIVYDEYSADKTREIAKDFGAKVFKYKHKKNFHETKQKAIDKATGDWILQLDADERVTPELADEISEVIALENDGIKNHQEKAFKKYPKKAKLFKRHQNLIEERALRRAQDKKGSLGDESDEYSAFFIPRVNYFLGKPLRHAGVYPDGVIRLFKNGKARLPGKSVHELMEVDGKVGWLFNELGHYESPTFKRYLERANRYTSLTAKELEKKGVPANILYLALYTTYRPLYTFLKLYLRHRGYKDGMRGFVWSLFSALHFPLSYFKYWTKVRE